MWRSAHEVWERLKSFAAVVDVLSLSKPWVDLEKYRRDRLKEALYEAELAEEFLKNGVIRNAASKAFQAVKAYLAAVAAAQRDKIVAAFPGRRRLSPTKVVERGGIGLSP